MKQVFTSEEMRPSKRTISIIKQMHTPIERLRGMVSTRCTVLTNELKI